MTPVAPIALFAYNRPIHTRLTVEALQRNILSKESDLIVFCDAPHSSAQIEAVREVRGYAHLIDGFRSVRIIERERNYGLARSIIDGVTSVVNEYGNIIVLEDDLVTSPYFLQYMNDGLQIYTQANEVASIHGYVYPINGLPETFFLRGADCWGWATWKDRWALFESEGAKLLNGLRRSGLSKMFDYNGSYPFTRMLAAQIEGKNNSWAIRWHASAFLQNKLTLYPGRSLVHNIGMDASGTHCGSNHIFDVSLSSSPILVGGIHIEESQMGRAMFEDFFRKTIGIQRRLKALLTDWLPLKQMLLVKRIYHAVTRRSVS